MRLLERLASWRKPLLIILVGLVLVALFDWCIDYQISKYQKDWKAENNNQSFYTGVVVSALGIIWRSSVVVWHWLDKNDKALLVMFTAGLFFVTAGLVLYTKRLWGATAELVKDASNSTKIELRSYVTVVIGAATYQDRENDLKFQARPIMVNTGRTPAHFVAFRAKIAVLPVPLPADFNINTADTPYIGGATLGPAQHFSFGPGLEDFVEDVEVAEIKRGVTRALYIWGVVTYLDIFGVRQFTEFCHHMAWNPNNEVMGYYQEGRNRST